MTTVPAILFALLMLALAAFGAWGFWSLHIHITHP